MNHDDSRTLMLCLGKELSELRLARDWTLGRVCNLLRATRNIAVTTATIRSYETAKRVINVPRLFDLAAVYQTPAPVLLTAAMRRAAMEASCPTCRREL